MSLDWIEKRPEKGLRFSCTRCGHCCCLHPGYVWVRPDEVEKIAAHLGMDVSTFGRRYLRRVGDRLSITEDARHRCALLGEDKLCTVYPVRPTQCRTFPFWEATLESEAAWTALKSFCPGTDAGELHPVSEIRERLRSGG